MSIPTRYRVHTPVRPPPQDLPGHEYKPDPSKITTVAELAESLETLRIWAGGPGIREISKRCAGGVPSRTTFYAMLRGRKLAALDVVLVFVTALGCHADLPMWADAWCRAAKNDTSPPSRTRPRYSERVERALGK